MHHNTDKFKENKKFDQKKVFWGTATIMAPIIRENDPFVA